MIIWDLDVAEGKDKKNVEKIFLKRRNYQEGLVPHFVYIVSTLSTGITLKICTCMLIL